MSLGSNHQRTDSKEGKQIAKTLQKHNTLMQKYISEGMTRNEASEKAFNDIKNRAQ